MSSKVLDIVKRILKPSKLGIAFFVIFTLLIVFFLPIYPVQIEYTKGTYVYTDGSVDTWRNYTGHLPLAVVLMGEFDWIQTDSNLVSETHTISKAIIQYPQPYILETWYCSANPIFVLMYIPMLFGVYFLCGLFSIYSHTKFVKGVKDLD